MEMVCKLKKETSMVGYHMKSKVITENSKGYYLIGLILILVGLLAINVDYNYLDYSIIGIGVLLVILGLNETLKSL